MIKYIGKYGEGGSFMARVKKKNATATDGKAVTVVVSRTVFPGHEQDYDEWVKKLSDAAKQSPGNTGVTILVPSKGQTGLHHVVMYFTDETSMHQWETSYIRQKLSHEADAFSRRMRQEATGLETWFSIPECPELESPPQWKMAIVTFIGVFLGSCGIIALIELFWEKANFWAFNAVVGALLVSLLTWVVMPIFSRYVFRKWLYK
jgi:antibiotic biosynthesis monooxygenase (ABM) superfamily enzyme